MAKTIRSASAYVLLAALASALGVACGGSADSKDVSQGKGGAASGGTGGVGGAGGTSTAPFPNPCGEIDTSYASKDAADLFAMSSIPTFDLHLPQADWKWLQEHAVEEKFVSAQACFEGKAIGQVGLRFKGSYGSLYNCFDSSGANTCRKLGMKLKFDEYVDGQRFYGLKRLNFQGYRYDSSYLKEKLSYDLYNAMGVTAPRASWALLRVNGEAQGLFGMVEAIDGRFTADRWPDNGDGNLFKEVWPGRSSHELLLSRLQTNEKVGDVAAFQAFSDAMNGAPDDQLRATLGAYTDPDYFARYMAVDDAIANFDGATTYYTEGSADESGNHNFYFYQEAPNRFRIIPWDLESTISLVSGFGNVPDWRHVPADCNQTYLAWGGPLKVMAPGCDRVFRALAVDLSAYQTAVRELLAGPFAEATMFATIDKHASFIRTEAIQDPHGPGEKAFEDDVNFLHQQVQALRRRLEFFLTGKTATPLELPLDQSTGFETSDDYGITMGTTQLSNAHTTASAELNRTAPIAGAQSLRMVFDFGNETKSWGQWTVFQIPLLGAPKDLTAMTGIRFKARSNVTRELRFNLNSPKHTKVSDGIQFGWDLELTPETRTLEVHFAEAKIPVWADDPGDRLADILKTTVGITFQPICVGRADTTGQLPEGTTDKGWAEFDDIEFF